MKQEEFLVAVEELKKNLRMSLVFGSESLAEFCIGYFYDDTEGNWKVYVNYDRMRHYIKLITKNEEEVYDKLINIIRYELPKDELQQGNIYKDK